MSLFQYETALALDGIDAIARALEAMVLDNPDVFKFTFRRGQVYNNMTRGIQCGDNPPYPWSHGEKIMDYLKVVSIPDTRIYENVRTLISY